MEKNRNRLLSILDRQRITVKQMYPDADEEDTAVTPYATGARCRALHNACVDRLVERAEFDHATDHIRVVLKDGNGYSGCMPAGQVVGRMNGNIRDLPTCKEVIESVVYGAEEILDRIGAKIRA